MMDDYLEVFPAFKGRGRAPAVKLELPVRSGSNHSRYRWTELSSLAVASFSREDTGPIRFSTMMDDYREVSGALKGRGCGLPGCFELVYLKSFSSGSNSGFL